MIENEPISCIKDGLTGQCRPIKDSEARRLLDEFKEQLKNIPTDTVLTELQANVASLATQLEAVQNTVNNLDETYATDANIQALLKQIEGIQNSVNNLDLLYATDADIQTLQSQIDLLRGSLDTLDATYATDEDIQTIQNRINNLDDSVDERFEKTMGAPSNSNIINITVASDGMMYKAIANGYIKFRAKTNTNQEATCRLVNMGSLTTSDTIEAKLINSQYQLSSGNMAFGCFIPVKKGDNIFIHYGNCTEPSLKFVRGEGV